VVEVEGAARKGRGGDGSYTWRKAFRIHRLVGDNGGREKFRL